MNSMVTRSSSVAFERQTSKHPYRLWLRATWSKRTGFSNPRNVILSRWMKNSPPAVWRGSIDQHVFLSRNTRNGWFEIRRTRLLRSKGWSSRCLSGKVLFWVFFWFTLIHCKLSWITAAFGYRLIPLRVGFYPRLTSSKITSWRTSKRRWGFRVHVGSMFFFLRLWVPVVDFWVPRRNTKKTQTKRHKSKSYQDTFKYNDFASIDGQKMFSDDFPWSPSKSG